MKRFILILIGCFLWLAAAKAEDMEVYFSPSLGCENNIIDNIRNSRKKIDAAVYAINNKDIVNALKKAYKRGVKIRILTDRLQASQKSSRVKDLHDYGINIRVHSKNKLEHNKFSVFDNKTVVTGSYNWTEPASRKNSENCMFLIKNKEAATEYSRRFDYLWQINTKKESDKWFSRQAKKNTTL